MTRPIVTEIDLDKIERNARQMRAEMIAASLGRLGTWLRKPRVSGGTQTA